MKSRVITGLILIAFTVAVFAVGFIFPALVGTAPAITFLVFMAVAMHEMYNAFKNIEIKCIRYSGLAYVVLLAPAFRGFGLTGVFVLFILCALVALVHSAFSSKHTVNDGVYSVFALVYPGLLMSPLYFMSTFDNYITVVIALGISIACACITDTFALFSGKLFGKHKLIPAVSPKKTVEGSIGGFVCAVLGGIGLSFAVSALMPEVAKIKVIILAAGIGIISQIGDLVASSIKRMCKIKDYGTIFPGHGGVLDRMDSIIASGIITYLVFTVWIGVL